MSTGIAAYSPCLVLFGTALHLRAFEKPPADFVSAGLAIRLDVFWEGN
jgi:hypothetical protein